jgi:hypothetical protein
MQQICVLQQRRNTQILRDQLFFLSCCENYVKVFSSCFMRTDGQADVLSQLNGYFYNYKHTPERCECAVVCRKYEN